VGAGLAREEALKSTTLFKPIKKAAIHKIAAFSYFSVVD